MSIKKEIAELLTQQFDPDFLEVVDESNKHFGHAENQNSAGESHFKVTIISSRFTGLTQIERQRAVYITLSCVMGRVHALALTTKAPGE